MSPWESDTEADSSGSSSAEECTPTSEAGNVDAHGTQVISSKAWKKEFFDRLADIKTFGDFACMTRYPHFINPGLELARSLIPLPLVPRDADAIKAQCEQAPFGRGDDTVVDVSVRKTWQLDASLFRCSNPAWPAFLDTVLQEAVQKLGMPKGTRAVPWKLLLYEEGSFFRPHKDSEKAPGMIGTLVISLPSKHEGGEVYLSHSNRRHAFATSDFSSFDLTALAWYSDVTHEIKPLSSGYRLVITYNLLQHGGSHPSAGIFVEQQAQLQVLLQKWTSSFQSKTRVIYRLDYKYSQSSLSIQNMKGRDAQLIRCLDQACQQTGFYIFLALMTKTEGCEDDDYYGGYDEDSLQLDHVTSLDGSHITGSVDVEMSEILGPDPYKGRAADSEDEGEFTGNESMPSQYRYHDSALLIVPRNGLVDLVKSPQCSAANLFRMVFDSTAASPVAPTRLETLSLFDSLLENLGSPIRDGGLLSMVLRASKLWSSPALYTKAMRAALWDTRPAIRHSLSDQQVMASQMRAPTEEISEVVAGFVNEFFSHPTDQDWNECLGDLVQIRSLTSLSAALEDIDKRLETEQLRQSFRCWRSSVETSKFEAKSYLNSLDLSFVMSLIQLNSTDEQWVSTRLLPRLSQRADKELLYALLKRLCAENGHLALKDTESLARRLLDATLPRLGLDIHDLEPKSQHSGLPQSSIYYHEASNNTDRTIRNVTKFAYLLENCFMCLLEEHGMSLLKNSHERLSDAISRLSAKGLERNTPMRPWRYGVPPAMERAPAEEFLGSLVVILHKYSLLDPPPFVKDLFMLLFTRYVLPDRPQDRPQRPIGWSHKPRFCSGHNPSRDKIHGTCYECGLIQDFIRAPDQAQGRFAYAQKIRSHLERVLPGEHYKCVTEKSGGSGNCHTLVVTKIGKDTEFKEEMRKYDGEMRNYEQRLLPFRQPVVKRLLGSDTYKSLITLETAPSGVSTAPVPTKRAAGESADQPPPSRQRTADVIDLTEE